MSEPWSLVFDSSSKMHFHSLPCIQIYPVTFKSLRNLGIEHKGSSHPTNAIIHGTSARDGQNFLPFFTSHKKLKCKGWIALLNKDRNKKLNSVLEEIWAFAWRNVRQALSWPTGVLPGIVTASAHCEPEKTRGTFPSTFTFSASSSNHIGHSLLE